ncbi:MAG: MBL fold metallo-hydrolase [Thermincola sp.]|nr:MBL fold metallo-hydrolase [Thermincola sp.]MDT3702658.1 MBL fold metallo-hydrolase [Thermincola sp.]
MILKSIVVGSFGANCYVVGCEETKEAVVIDPGGEVNLILDELKGKGLKVKYIVNTHGHIDHIGGNDELREATGAQVMIHEQDASMLIEPKLNFSGMMGRQEGFRAADTILKEGDVIEFGTIKLKVLHTPGHTKGGICLLTDGLVFTGDTLFNESIGRTDFPGGDYDSIIKSIKEKLMTLPDETIVYPGHMGDSTIAHERKYNPFLR